MKRITDPSFKYYPACDTDIRRTFRRVERERKARAQMVVTTSREEQARRSVRDFHLRYIAGG